VLIITFKGCINREGYFIRVLLFAALATAIFYSFGYILTSILDLSPHQERTIIPITDMVFLSGCALAILYQASFCISRLHDIGLSSRLFLLFFIISFIPKLAALGILFGLFLLLMPGSKKDNKFGPQPRPLLAFLVD
jgi:uncharacterized membrane protein YhaH (DUF805 family)